MGERLPLTGALPCYNLYETADGRKLALGALEPHFWERFCRLAGRDDLLRRQYSPSLRVHREMRELFRTRTRGEWMDAPQPRGHPRRARALGRRGAGPPPGPGARRPGGRTGPPAAARPFPARFDGERPAAGGAVPDLGAETRPLLEEMGAPDLAGASGVGRRFSFKRWVKRLFF